MTKKNLTMKLTFSTKQGPGGTWTGICNETGQKVTGKRTRDAARSAVKRLAEKTFTAPITSTLKPGAPAPVAKRKVNRIAFVVDRSGSMGSLTKNALASLRNNIEAIRVQSAKTGQEVEISLYSFNTSVTPIVTNCPLAQFKGVDFYASYFSALGSTALFDATGQAITDLQNHLVRADEDVSYLVITLTDGEENASYRFNAGSLNRLIKDVQATDLWTLTFLLPPGAKRDFCTSFGVPDGNVAEWAATTQGLERATAQTTQGIGTYFVGRALGQNSVKSFYTDLSGVTASALKKNLDDLSNQVKVFPVKQEVDIKTFVESQGLSYVPGSAFYQLTKDEKKVQGYKELLVMEKGKRNVYGGQDARDVLGMPSGDLRVKPGNHGNFDIFVQSTSLNRKLVRGTKLLVKLT